MPITFDNEALFASGPARVHVGGQALRHARERSLSGRGERLFSQGVTGRSIVQVGALLADTHDGLQAQIDAIETKLDGLPRTLVDDLERTWTNVTMIAFEPAAITRLGPRWKLDYRIEYVQSTP